MVLFKARDLYAKNNVVYKTSDILCMKLYSFNTINVYIIH